MNKRVAYLLIAGLVAAPVLALAADGDLFSDPTAGISLTKPESWNFMTAEQNKENLEAVKFKDAEFEQAVRKYATLPMVIVAKYPEPHDDLNPTVKINMRSLGNFDGSKPLEILDAAIAPMKNMFADFTLADGPKEVAVDGLKAGYAKIHYTLEAGDGRTFPTCSELWIVPRGKHFFIIGAGSHQQRPAEQEEVRQIVSSIKIEK